VDVTYRILLETGTDALLAEDGSNLVTEQTVASPTEGTLSLAGEQPNVFPDRAMRVVVPGNHLVVISRRRAGRWHVRNGVYRASTSVDSLRIALPLTQGTTSELVIQGQQPTVTASTAGGPVTVTPSEGVLTIQGQQALVTVTASPNNATLTLQGQQPQTIAETSPTEATLLLQGQQPTVTGTSTGAATASPTEGTLAIVGEQPTLLLQGVPLELPQESGGARTDMARYMRRLRQQQAVLVMAEEFLKRVA